MSFEENSTPPKQGANFQEEVQSTPSFLFSSLSSPRSFELELSPTHRLDARLEARAATGAREDVARDCIVEGAVLFLTSGTKSQRRGATFDVERKKWLWQSGEEEEREKITLSFFNSEFLSFRKLSPFLSPSDSVAMACL